MRCTERHARPSGPRRPPEYTLIVMVLAALLAVLVIAVWRGDRGGPAPRA